MTDMGGPVSMIVVGSAKIQTTSEFRSVVAAAALSECKV